MIEVGDPLPNLGTEVYNSSGVLQDGGAVSLLLTLPDQTTIAGPVPLSIAHPSSGVYTAFHVTTMAGQYSAKWTVTGANAGVQTDYYQVEDPDIGIVSLDEVRAWLRIRRSDDDEMLRSLILAATSACESAEGTNRAWKRRVVTGEVQTTYDGCQIQLRVAPVISITSITAGGVAQTVGDYDLNRSTGRVWGSWPSTTRRGTIAVTYVAGTTAPIPALVRDGVLEMVRHLYATQRGGSGIPRQEEPDWTASAGYLIPNRVTMAWRAFQSAGL